MRPRPVSAIGVVARPGASLSVRRLRRTIAILIAASALTVSTVASARPPAFINDMFRRNLQHPSTLSLWASDALIHLRWSHWGSSITSATGQITEHGLGATGPRCAGKLGRDGYGWRCFAVRVSASAIRDCHGHRVYSVVRYFAFGHWQTTRFDPNRCSVAAS